MRKLLLAAERANMLARAAACPGFPRCAIFSLVQLTPELGLRFSPWIGQPCWHDVCGPIRHEQDVAQDLP